MRTGSLAASHFVIAPLALTERRRPEARRLTSLVTHSKKLFEYVGEPGLRFGNIVKPEDGAGEADEIDRRESGAPRAELPSWKFRGNRLLAGQAHGA
jgi:hypothetical protein